MISDEGIALADRADLVYVSDETPGVRRVTRGRGFSYHLPDGTLVDDPGLKQWIASLGIPPAWTDVWISLEPRGHILATGRDAEGRKQYIYHEDWERIRDEAKFERLGSFARDLPDLRRTIDADLRTKGLPQEKVIALVVTLLDRTLMRVGNKEYADRNEAYGLTTLVNQHAEVAASQIRFSFTGKAGKEHEVAVQDRRLARMVSACQELDGQRLFSYTSDNGTGSVSSSDVNQYLRERTGTNYSAKDFRTWGGTTVVAAELVSSGPAANLNGALEGRILSAVDAAAQRLGNTRAVCRASYVHPSIPEAYRSGELAEAWRRARRGKWISRAESMVRAVLKA